MIKSTLVVLAATALTILIVNRADAQRDDHKFEAGGQFTLLNVQTRSATGISGTTLTRDRTTVAGFGGRVGYNFSKYLGFEAEGNFFPRDRDVEGGQKIQGLFGVKVGKRSKRVGLFAKARPGFIRLAKGDYRFGTGGCPAVFPPPIGCFQPVAQTNFAVDIGGVVELYPSPRTIVRFDAGDTIVRFGARRVAATSSVFTVPVVFSVGAETTHNFQASVGFGFRF